jgi:formate dehydrogenase subunit gamma
MAMLLARIRFAVGACVLLGLIALAMPARAQQPNPDGSANPTASSVKEDQLLREMRIISGRGSIPDVKSYNIEQPAGRSWRQFHEVWLPRLGGAAILLMLAALVLFYLIRGMVRIEAGRSGRTLVRFSTLERLVHWMTAASFVALALSGLNITFGKRLLEPWIGPEAFAAWSQWAKYAHNYLSFPFTLGVVVILLMWVAWNIPDKADVAWIKRGGGIVGHEHPPAGRFNAGQKLIYWIVVIGGGRGRGERLSADVPVLRHRYRRHAIGPDGPRHRGAPVRRRHDRPCLYRHRRHGGGVRGDVGRHGRRQLGEAAPQHLARPGDRQRACDPAATARPHGSRRIAGFRSARPRSRTQPRQAPETDTG